MEERFAEALRICKPGAYGLVWALPRTSHWTATALEDAGWELKDCIVHLFGNGFPKSQSIGKNVEKVAPATPEAKLWDGFGTALKPAVENWILVRKPIKGTIVANVLEWGVGGLNIDATRVECKSRPLIVVDPKQTKNNAYSGRMDGSLLGGSRSDGVTSQGRFPANLVLSHAHDCTSDGCADGCPVKELDRQTDGTRASKSAKGGRVKKNNSMFFSDSTYQDFPSYGDGGDGKNASRYFPKFHYFPKASLSDRSHKGQVQNNHPTVKNRELMRWLCRLVTPPGGTVLDCFAGSGSTAIACLEEGFNYVLIEQDPESVQTAKARVAVWLKENRPEPAPEKAAPSKAESGQLALFDMLT
jgi:site-specific DNA-methyltransferase (adenine-specific)